MKITFEIPDERFDEFEKKHGGPTKVPLYNMEEAAEYIQQMAKIAEGRGNMDRTLEELADLIICFMHFVHMHNVEDDLQWWLTQKLARDL